MRFHQSVLWSKSTGHPRYAGIFMTSNTSLPHCGSGTVCTWFIFSGLSNVRATLHHFQGWMKCQRCSWPSQFPFPSDLVSLGSTAPTWTEGIDINLWGKGFFIYLFSRQRENRASASIDFSYVCCDSVAKFWEFHIFWLPLKTNPQICFSMPWGVIKCFTFEKITICTPVLLFVPNPITVSLFCLY